MIPTPNRRRRVRPFERTLGPPPPDAVFESGLYLTLDQVEITEAGGAPVVLNGNLALSWVKSTFEGTLDANSELENASARVGLHGAVTLELAMNAGADVAGSLRLAVIPLPPFTVGEITVSPFIQVRLHLIAGADADARLGLVAPFRFGSGFAFDGATPRAGMTWPPRHAPEVGLPDAAVILTAGVELEVTLVLLMAIGAGLPVPIGGPALGASFGTLVSVDPVAGVDLNGAVKIAGGWVLPGLDGLPDIPEGLPLIHPVTQFNIPSAGGPITPGSLSTRWSRLFDVTVNDGAAAALPASDGLVVVEDQGSPWLATLDGAGVPLSQSTSGPTDLWAPVGMARAVDGDIMVAGQDGGVRVDRFPPPVNRARHGSIQCPTQIRRSASRSCPGPPGGRSWPAR